MLLPTTLQELMENTSMKIFGKLPGGYFLFCKNPMRTRENDRSPGNQTSEQLLANGDLRHEVVADRV
jgi:hypothetical protein